MDKEMILKNWLEKAENIAEREAKLEEFIQDWIDNKIPLRDEQIQQTIDDVNSTLDFMKKQADALIKDYYIASKAEVLRKKGLTLSKSDETSFDINIDALEIFDKILSSNIEEESNLKVKEKTLEEITAERDDAYAKLRSDIASKAVTLEEASKKSNS